VIQPSKQHSADQATVPGSRLRRLWENGGFALTTQVLPPLVLPQAILHNLATGLLKAFPGVLVADAPDGAIACQSIAQAVLAHRGGLAPIVQISGRDRNRLALQSDLLGLGALNLPDVLIDTRPITRASLGHNADARLVLDLDGPALLATAARLRDEARLLSGARLKTPPLFYLGALIALDQPLAVEQLAAAQFLVSAPLAHHLLVATLPSFVQTYADFLRSRPLLVSLPLAGGVQALQATLQVLQPVPAIRGWNIVIADAAALAALPQLSARDLSLLERPE
jgi:methylenetetrahydrofolate reductase (NADPH)